jgi:surfeit locus 1 family protein
MRARWVMVRPGMLALHAVALAAVALCLIAGLWQLDVYESEQDSERAERASAAAVPLTDELGPDEGMTNELVGLPVVAEGHYAPADQQILVAGRAHSGRDGYWVVSPLVLDNGSAILVVRGWTPEELAPAVPSAPVRVTGPLEPGEEAGADSELGSNRVVDSVRIPSLVGQLPYDLYSAMMIRTAERPAPSDGLAAVDASAPEVPWTSGLRNLAYALQWWVFGAFAVFMWWRICADRLGRGSDDDPEPEGDPAPEDDPAPDSPYDAA